MNGLICITWNNRNLLDCVIDCNASISDKTREFINVELTIFKCHSASPENYSRDYFIHLFIRTLILRVFCICFCYCLKIVWNGWNKLLSVDDIYSFLFSFLFYFTTRKMVVIHKFQTPRKKVINYLSRVFLHTNLLSRTSTYSICSTINCSI